MRRRSLFPQVVIDRDTESEESSSGDEEEEEGEANVVLPEEETIEDSKKKGKTPITITLKKVCKVYPFFIFAQPSRLLNSMVVGFLNNVFFQVCKKTGHEAGFRGATYIDCPMKPCFLCKMPGTYLLV